MPASTRAIAIRCSSPVCSRGDVTPHHLRFRSHGGDDTAENVTALCVWCHLEGVHGGRIRAVPPASAIRWTLGARPILSALRAGISTTGFLPRALHKASGAIESVQRRHGLELRIEGQPVAFRLPLSTRASPQALAALEQAAKNRSSRAELRYAPNLARTFTGEQHRLFYELRIDGHLLHSHAETRRSWRETRQIGRTLAQITAGLGIAFVLLALRMARTRKSWTTPDLAR